MIFTKHLKFSVFFLLCIFLRINIGFTEEKIWNLPINISKENTEISFIIESTWHDVIGKLNNLTGKVYLKELNNFRSVAGEVAFNVVDMDTENSSRDEKMRKVMDVSQFPSVIFKLDDVKDLNEPSAISNDSQNITINGSMTIKGVTKKLSILSSIKKINSNFLIESSFIINWKEFGVEDPSILIAKVYPDVKINVKLKL